MMRIHSHFDTRFICPVSHQEMRLGVGHTFGDLSDEAVAEVFEGQLSHEDGRRHVVRGAVGIRERSAGRTLRLIST